MSVHGNENASQAPTRIVSRAQKQPDIGSSLATRKDNNVCPTESVIRFFEFLCLKPTSQQSLFGTGVDLTVESIFSPAKLV